MKNLFILFLIVSCSTQKGNLEKISKGKPIGVISFKVFDKSGKDISDTCVVKYSLGNGKETRAYRAIYAPHFLELSSELEVNYIMCAINLLVYKYNFDGFRFKVPNSDAYFFGEYHFQYDYKASYRDTKFYAEAKKCEYDNDRSGYCGNSSETWTNDGKLKLLKIEKIDEPALEKAFPNHGKEVRHIDNMRPRNIL